VNVKAKIHTCIYKLGQLNPQLPEYRTASVYRLAFGSIASRKSVTRFAPEQGSLPAMIAAAKAMRNDAGV